MSAREAYYDDDEPRPRHWGRGAAPEARYINGRKVRAAGQIDEYGMYYPIPPSRGRGVVQFLASAFAVVAFCLMLFAVFGRGTPLTTIAPLPTAEIGQTSGGATFSQPRQDAPVAAPEAPSEAGGVQVEPTAPPPPEEAAISTTPLPDVPATPLPDPGDPAFVDSFQEPACAPAGAFLTYLPGHPCYGRNGGVALPQSGDAFADSFK